MSHSTQALTTTCTSCAWSISIHGTDCCVSFGALPQLCAISCIYIPDGRRQSSLQGDTCKYDLTGYSAVETLLHLLISDSLFSSSLRVPLVIPSGWVGCVPPRKGGSFFPGSVLTKPSILTFRDSFSIC